MRITAARHRHTHRVQYFVREIFPHTAAVTVIVVQVQFFQPVIISAILIIIKIQLEAVTVGIGRSYKRQAGVPLCAYCHISCHFAVNHHIGSVVLFCKRIFQYILPVLLRNLYIDFVHSALPKEVLCVSKAAVRFLRFPCPEIYSRQNRRYRKP